jgi:two-component system response regulator
MVGSAGKRILLVEDNPGDVQLLRTAFAEIGVDPPLDIAETGEAALAYPDRNAAPVLVILDLNLPIVGGLEVLERLMRRPGWTTPIVILTSSEREQEHEHARRAGATQVLIKPSTWIEHLGLARRLAQLGGIA